MSPVTLVTFDHFKYFGTNGPDFRRLAPKLTNEMYSWNQRRRIIIVDYSDNGEVDQILRIAEKASPSGQSRIGKATKLSNRKRPRPSGVAYHGAKK